MSDKSWEARMFTLTLTLTLSHSLIHSLSSFHFHVYAQKPLFIAENCNFFGDSTIVTLSCYFRCHRAGSQLKTLTFQCEAVRVGEISIFLTIL